MKTWSSTLIAAFFVFCAITPVLAFPSDNLSSKLSGRILLDIEHNGEAWYVYPGDFHRYYLGTAADAYSIMRNLSLGVSNDNFLNIASSTALAYSDKFKGLILLKPEDAGRAYYVNPDDKSLIYMADAAGAYSLMRQYSLGITASDLKTIPIGKIILDDAGQEISRQWQNLGWWGRVNQDYVKVMSEPKLDSTRTGTFFSNNIIKVLGVKKGDGHIWYQVDGGKYPGAYVDSMFVSAIAQPAPEYSVIPPSEIKENDYWIDVDMTNKILTVYRFDATVFITYISLGRLDAPTVTGTYHVWLKAKKDDMRSQPLSTHPYDLADVPWVMYYYKSFSVHGTYWHDNFGSRVSSGCTNATQGDSKYLFYLTSPTVGDINEVRASSTNPGVLVNNHY